MIVSFSGYFQKILITCGGLADEVQHLALVRVSELQRGINAQPRQDYAIQVKTPVGKIWSPEDCDRDLCVDVSRMPTLQTPWALWDCRGGQLFPSKSKKSPSPTHKAVDVLISWLPRQQLGLISASPSCGYTGPDKGVKGFSPKEFKGQLFMCPNKSWRSPLGNGFEGV